MAKGFRGGFPGGGNMNSLIQQAQRMQRQLEEAQAEAAELKHEVTTGGGMVRILVNAQHQIEELEIKAEAIDPEDPEMLQDLIIAAVNEAMRGLDEQVEKKMEKFSGMAGGLGGMLGL